MTQPLPVEAERLDRYEILAELASGGMATVYLGRLPGAGGFERLVAIKRLHPHLERDTAFVSMFLDEARIAARIRHPNVVSTLEIGTAERGYFLVMDYVEGPTLSRLLSKAAQTGQRIPTKVALRILHDTLSGLHAAHELIDEQGKPLHIVHRDVSPQNVLIGTDGTSRITDFGVARAMNRLSHTSTGQLKGKLGYMAPEQARGEEVDRRADLFAAGIMLWEVLAGRRLFKGRSETDAETLHRVLEMQIPPVGPQNPDVTPAIDQVILRSLDRDLAKRYATAADFIDALEEAAGPLVGSARDVAKYLETTVGQEIAERRESVRTMGAAVMGENSMPNVPRLVPSSVSSATLSVPHLTQSGPVSVVLQQQPASKGNAVLIGVLAGALIVALGGVGLLLALRGGAPQPAPATSATASAATSAEPPKADAPKDPASASAGAAAASSTAPAAASSAPKLGGPWKTPQGGGPVVPKPGGGDGLSVNPYRPLSDVATHALTWMLIALSVLAIAYRYYSAFLAAKVLCLDGDATTPAHEKNDGQNFHPTNKWVLFGHHFAAITGAGPLIGPVLAAQFGFLPGYTWILFGVVIAGAVQDFVVLVGSVRHGGRSLAELARDELGDFVGALTGVSILFIVVVALAGLGRVVVEALAESAWGVFTIGTSIPIALGMGLFIYKVRGGSARGIREATIGGVVLLLFALVAGKWVQDSSFGEVFRLSKTTLTLSIAAYGFFASILPVWMLLCPRDYLSSYLKIGTILLLVVGILVVNPKIEMPLVNDMTDTGVRIGADTFGRVSRGSLFPFVFITIACGAISGFHALVASGTTPKMVSNEKDCRPIGYGAMLMEGLVGITALIAATALPPSDYFAINTDPKIPVVAVDGHGIARNEADLRALDTAGLGEKDRKILGLAPGETAASLAAKKGAAVKASDALHLSNQALAALGYSVDAHAHEATSLTEADFLRMGIKVTDLPALSRASGEVVAARTGGAVSLAVGMARVFSGLPGMRSLLSYWYHFAIMFEALFVLTTIDTGTRIGRFLVQEFVGRRFKKAGDPAWVPGAVVSTALVVAGFCYFILTGNIGTIWPMFGVANQLLALTALAVGTTLVLKRAKKASYALVTFLPMCFVGTTTLTAGVRAIFEIYLPQTTVPATATIGWVNLAMTTTLLTCVAFVLLGSTKRWAELLRARTATTA